MRKCISVLLVSLLIYDFGGYYLRFNLSQKHIRREIKMEIRKGLQEEDLTLFTHAQMQDPGIIWTRPDKEFLYQGEMYDVVKTSIREGDTVYSCTRDSNEKQLIAYFKKFQKKEKETAKNIRKLLSLQFFPDTASLMKPITPSAFSYPLMFFSFCSSNPEVHSPPPKSISLTC